MSEHKPSSQTAPSLKTAALKVAYGRTQRLHGVTLPEFRAGDCVGVLGANAAGKSTLLRALAGQQRYLGSVTWCGRELQRLSARERARSIGYMPQAIPQPSALRPAELLPSAWRALDLVGGAAERDAACFELCAALGIAEQWETPLQRLSGGKRQLVGLALALLRQPQLLLLDEPTSALDLRWRLTVLTHIQRMMQARGGIVVAVLHDLDLAARFCNRMVLLQHGEVVACGATETVLTSEHLAQVFGVEARIGQSALGHPHIDVLRPLDF